MVYTVRKFVQELNPKRRWRLLSGTTVLAYLPGFLLSLFTLGCVLIGLWAATWPVDGLELIQSEGLITAVIAGGPAAQAGLQVGDTIVAIDQHPFAQIQSYAARRANETLTFTIQRGGEILEFALRLAAPPASAVLWNLIPLVVALGFWGSGVALYVLRPRNSVCTAFFLTSQAVTLAMAAGMLSGFNLHWAIHLFNLSLLLLPPLMVHLSVEIVQPRQARMYSLWKLLLVLSLVLIVPEVLVFWFQPGYWGARPEAWSVMRIVTRTYLALTSVGVTVGLIFAYNRTHSADLRRRLRGIAVGMAVGVFPLVFLSLLPEVLWGAGSGVPVQFTFILMLLIPITHAYVIFKHDLAPFDRFLNRSLVIFSIGLIWVALYLVSIGAAVLLFEDTVRLWPFLGALVTIGLAILFTPLRTSIQRLVDRAFYGGWYDYRSVITHLSHELGGVTSRQELAQRLVEPVASGLRLQGAALYLCASDGELVVEKAVGLHVPPQIERAAVAQAAQASTTIRPLQALPDLAPDPVDAAVAWYLPLVKEQQLKGLLLLGRKRDDDFFEPSDNEILQTLQEQASLAAANVLLMADLQQALDALEMAQQMLLTAREEERRTLAWELHDGPVQDLVALGYRLCEVRDRAWVYEPGLADIVEEIRAETNRIMAVTRTVCSALRTDVLDVMGLGTAMAQYAYDLMQKTGVVVYLDVPRVGSKVEDPLGIVLLRIFQEALNNAIVHAGVSEVWTRLRLDETSYELLVWDKGEGFVVPERLETFALKGHFGMVTMKERMTAIHGHLTVQSKPGGGTRIRAWGTRI